MLSPATGEAGGHRVGVVPTDRVGFLQPAKPSERLPEVAEHRVTAVAEADVTLDALAA